MGKVKRKSFRFKILSTAYIGPYVVDFYCPKAKLIVELDGLHHKESEIATYDKERSIYLEGLGFKVLRFWNYEVDKNVTDVIEKIHKNFPLPSSQRRD